MNHLGTMELETDRLILRRFTLSDSKAMFNNWANDPEVTKFLTWSTHVSIETSEDVLKDWVNHYNDNTFYLWAVTLKDSNIGPIGSISVVHIDNKVDAAYIGYCIGRKWWHQGITSEAFSKVISFLIEKIGIARIEARHDIQNPNSGNVMRKCGLKYEGTLRKADKNNQGICDMTIYGLLAEDYLSAIGKDKKE